MQILEVGTASTWTLPGVAPGSNNPLKKIELDAENSGMGSSLTFDEKHLSVSFNGEATLTGMDNGQGGFIRNISFNLIDSEDKVTSYTQTLIIH